MPKVHPSHIGIEKRRHRRVLVVRPINSLIEKKSQTENYRVHLMNISLSGAQIYANQTMQVSEPISLELPSLEATPKVILKGRIVWIHKNPMKTMGRFAYGINFENVSPENIEFLEQNFYFGEKTETSNGGLIIDG
jgi:c-di-GMP-binding flagellar brake protein YcgR